MRTFILLLTIVSASGCDFLPDLFDRGNSTDVRVHLVPSGTVLPSPPYGRFDVRGSRGTATFSTVGAEIRSTVKVEGLKPDHTYRLFLHVSEESWEEVRFRMIMGDSTARFGPWEDGASFTTTERGTGEAHFVFEKPFSPDTSASYVSAWINDNVVEGTVLLSRSVHASELR